jgi:hypothetical protein
VVTGASQKIGAEGFKAAGFQESGSKNKWSRPRLWAVSERLLTLQTLLPSCFGRRTLDHRLTA